jgi:protein gp37
LADTLDLDGIDWVIYGGESGQHYRPHDVQWARDMRAACTATGVAFFDKQSAGRTQRHEPFLDGERVHEYPTPRLRPDSRQGELFGGFLRGAA